MTLDEAIEQAHEKSNDLKLDNCRCANDHYQLAIWLEELKNYQKMFTTADGVLVKTGDTVWVNGSTSTTDAMVRDAVTSYEYFGPIPVNCSYSSKEAALNIRGKKS